MNKATSVEMRKSLELVQMMKQAGIPFIPMPYLSIDEHDQMVAQVHQKLKAIENMLEQEEEK